MTTPTAKPATPLPWEMTRDSYAVMRIWGADGYDVACTKGDGSIPIKGRYDNAAYIVHACNAYPELVAALRGLNVVYGPLASSMKIGSERRLLWERAFAILAKLGESA